MTEHETGRPHDETAGQTSEESETTLPACRRCGRRLNRATVVETRVGPYCKKHADRLPPHLRRVGGAS